MTAERKFMNNASLSIPMVSVWNLENPNQEKQKKREEEKTFVHILVGTRSLITQKENQ